RYSKRLLAAIDWAMEIEPAVRPHAVADFIAALTLEASETPASESMFGKMIGRFTRGES
ncbi:MAG: hypothetical protein HQL49_10425, partial [Gammaproteobacteria bacterium]|nr:hypothetical protein [Gammaproteobacteria bacterium]